MRKTVLTIILLASIRICFGGNPMQDLIRNAGNASDYPSDNLVVIFDSIRTDVKESGLSYVTTHTLTKILTAKGAVDQSTVKFGYDPLSAYVDIKKVVIYKNDGTIRELDPSKTMDYPAPARMIYWGAREKMMAIGRLEPGDAVEVIGFRKGFTYALLGQDDEDKYIPPMKGHFYDIVEFYSSFPVKNKVYQVIMPKDKPLQYEVYNGEIRSAISFSGDQVIYTFTKKDITPFTSENRMVALSDVATKLLVSTSPDWYAKSKWFYSVNENFGSFNSTPAIKSKVDEILKGSKNELDSISRLTHWVADEVRYSGISMGCGEGYTLHKGEMTFADRCGVCKDKAGMLITMLRAAGFKAYPAMTMAGSRIDYIPADQFNHSVTVVKMSDGKYHLLDPTWVPFVRELWSSAEQQQQYLMGVPEGADLATTPVSDPENHYIRITGNSTLSADGTLTGTIMLTAEGQSDASVRGMFRSYPKVQWNQMVERELMKVSSLAKITKIDFSDPIDYSAGPIRVEISYEIPEYAFLSGDQMMFTPLAAYGIFRNIQGQLFFNTDERNKQYPFRDRCSRLVEINEEITLPAVKQFISMPDSRKNGGKVCSFEGGYKLNGNTLQLNEKVVLGKRIYDAADWPEFKNAVNAENYFAKQPVVFRIQK